MNQVLYTILKVVMVLALYFMAAKGTSETSVRSGTCEGKTDQLLRRSIASLRPESRTLREAVCGGGRSCGQVNGMSCGSC